MREESEEVICYVLLSQYKWYNVSGLSVWWWEWWWCSRGSADWRLAGGHCTRHQHYAAAVLQSPLQLHAAHTTTTHQARVAGRGQKTFVSNNKWTNFSPFKNVAPQFHTKE